MSDDYTLQNELQDMDSPLAKMPRTMPYAVPEGYFSRLTDTIISVTADSKLPTNHTALPYQVPAGYFDQLPGKLLAAAKRSEDGNLKNKQVTFAPRTQWLTAAMLALIVTLGGYIMFTGDRYSRSEQMLSSIPATELKNYVEARYGLNAGKVLRETKVYDLNVDSKDIIAYLNETGWE